MSFGDIRSTAEGIRLVTNTQGRDQVVAFLTNLQGREIVQEGSMVMYCNMF
jgi:hypothetical protein